MIENEVYGELLEAEADPRLDTVISLLRLIAWLLCGLVFAAGTALIVFLF